MKKTTRTSLFDHVVDVARSKGLVKNGDLTVITAGVPLGISGTTNLVKVQLVGDVLVTGAGISLGSVCSNLCVCKNEAEARPKFSHRGHHCCSNHQ